MSRMMLGRRRSPNKLFGSCFNRIPVRTQSHEIDKEEEEEEEEEVNEGEETVCVGGERGPEKQWRGVGSLGGLDSSFT